MCCFFRQQTQHLLPSLGTGSPKGALWEFVGKVIFSLFDPKNRFSAFNGPINIAGGRLDILFHFPNDWYKNIVVDGSSKGSPVENSGKSHFFTFRSEKSF